MKVRIQELKIVEHDFKPAYAVFYSGEDAVDTLVALFNHKSAADFFVDARASYAKVKYYIRAVDND